VYNGQQHFAHLDASGNIRDVWYDGSEWHLQQITNAEGPGPAVPAVPVVSPRPTPPAEGDLFVSVYSGQHHFAYRDASGNIQDAWYDGSEWHLQQITNADGRGPTAPAVPVVSPRPTPPAEGDLFVSVYGGQHHFAYRDASGNIQDVWYDGSKWDLQQITNAGGLGPTVLAVPAVPGVPAVPAVPVVSPGTTPPAKGDLFVSVYGGQHHFAYRDASGNIQDAWYDGSEWHPQQITNAGGGGRTVPTETGLYITSPAPTPAAKGDLFVSVYGGQHHFAYRDASGNIQDVWYDGSEWHPQQITNAGGHGPTETGLYVASPAPTPAVVGDLFVSVYGGQHHFAYRDASGNIQDVWYDGNKWHPRQINTEGMTGWPSAAGGLFVCVYNRQQHFAYRDADGSIWDSWWGDPGMATRIVEVALGSSRAFVQVADLDHAGNAGEKVGSKNTFNLEGVSGTLEGVAQAVLDGLKKVAPSKTTVELGIQLAVKNGKLTALIVEGKVEASLKVTFEWGPRPAAATVTVSPSGRTEIEGGEGTVTSETTPSQSDGPAA
jgi:uncharacterized protein YdeI (BOF family)